MGHPRSGYQTPRSNAQRCLPCAQDPASPGLCALIVKQHDKNAQRFFGLKECHGTRPGQ
jgi:hypothetical protein